MICSHEVSVKDSICLTDQQAVIILKAEEFNMKKTCILCFVFILLLTACRDGGGVPIKKTHIGSECGETIELCETETAVTERGPFPDKISDERGDTAFCEEEPPGTEERPVPGVPAKVLRVFSTDAIQTIKNSVQDGREVVANCYTGQGHFYQTEEDFLEHRGEEVFSPYGTIPTSELALSLIITYTLGEKGTEEDRWPIDRIHLYMAYGWEEGPQTNAGQDAIVVSWDDERLGFEPGEDAFEAKTFFRGANGVERILTSKENPDSLAAGAAAWTFEIGIQDSRRFGYAKLTLWPREPMFYSMDSQTEFEYMSLQETYYHWYRNTTPEFEEYGGGLFPSAVCHGFEDTMNQACLLAYLDEQRTQTSGASAGPKE